LSKEINLPPEAAHLLFSANRWECKEDMEKTLRSGTTLVVDRYAASGAVYTAVNTGRSLNWCRQADIGLPKPDCVVFLEVSKRQQELRGDWGKERFEHEAFQQRWEIKRQYMDHYKRRSKWIGNARRNTAENTVCYSRSSISWYRIARWLKKMLISLCVSMFLCQQRITILVILCDI